MRGSEEITREERGKQQRVVLPLLATKGPQPPVEVELFLLATSYHNLRLVGIEEPHPWVLKKVLRGLVTTMVLESQMVERFLCPQVTKKVPPGLETTMVLEMMEEPRLPLRVVKEVPQSMEGMARLSVPPVTEPLLHLLEILYG
ncbi:hypothetical protein Droror1_Dr00002070 [Drosera rotundifolia]